MKSTRSLIVGVLAGFAAGAAIGMLFAPHKGKVTRKRLLRKGEDIAEKTGDAFQDIGENITKKFDMLKRDVTGRF
jgi:gas vesicle protein